MSETLNLSEIESPVGTLTAGFTNKGLGLALLSFNKIDSLELPKALSGFKLREKKSELHGLLKEELSAYFDRNLAQFSIPLDLHGTDFQKRVWSALLEVPYGATRSYKEQALFVGDLKAIRAVATANGANPIAIIVPCHRIIGSNQSLTGYAGGLERKKFLLDLESNQQKLF